ncbi:MAG: MurR/RpiR family transcriptional regulator [Christensenellaceae bacterium]|nr:MurR/RpiR family transcriptional regulator [Christensenellaceae bacterium]
MQDDLITKMKLLSNTFTKAEKKIADYILENGNDVLYMSISELAETCGVGDTSVFRFCKHLDKKGYMDFKMDLAQALSLREDNSPNISDNSGFSKDSIEDIAEKSLKLNIDALHETLRINDIKNIEKAAELMLSANRIMFYGSGSSMSSAYEAYCRFLRISPKAFALFDSHLQAMSASLLGPGDVAVAFSYSGATKDTIYTANLAHKAGAKIIAITRFSKSPLTEISDLTLLCGANESPLQGGSFTVKISQLFIIDLLFISFMKMSGKQAEINRKKTSNSIVEKII